MVGKIRPSLAETCLRMLKMAFFDHAWRKKRIKERIGVLLRKKKQKTMGLLQIINRIDTHKQTQQTDVDLELGIDVNG